ncbi:MAG: glycosyltransferase family 4 protein [Myxococcales bacterium]|nr:glycosyltransferase family 4 protein [Myxococcales bacterium]
MRVFYLTTEFPWPPVSGGRVRSLAQLKVLASLPEVERITILTLRETDIPSSELSALEREVPKSRVLVPQFHPIHLRQFPHYFAWVAILRLVKRWPYLAGKWVSPSVYHAISRQLSEPVDAVYIDHLGMGVYLDLVRRAQPRARVVLEQHNVESDFFLQFYERQKNPLKAAIAKNEHAAARRFEIETMKKVDAVVAISDSDAGKFADMAGVRAHMVPQVMPHDRRPWSPPRDAGRAPRLVYVGNLTWHPNVEGLDWFCTQVWPLVREARPDAVVHVGGSGLTKGPDGRPVVPDAWKTPGVEVIGFVESLDAFYDGAVGFLAPILGGSGVRIKVLEAFRAGLPLVTTDAGALGLPIEHRREALIGNDARAYADNVIDLLGDESLQRTLRDHGYDYLDKHHGLATAQGVMRAALGIQT